MPTITTKMGDPADFRSRLEPGRLLTRLLLVATAGFAAWAVLCSVHCKHGKSNSYTSQNTVPGQTLLFYSSPDDAFCIQHSSQQRNQCGDSPLIASGLFLDTYNETGWYRLEIRVEDTPKVDNRTKARAAGFLEGIASAPQIYNYWTNYRLNEYKHAKVPGQPAASLKAYAEEQKKYLDEQVGSKPDDPFWRGLDLVLAQFEGLVEGYSEAALPGQELTWVDLYLLQAVGDLYDLNVVYHDEHPTGFRFAEGHGLLGPGGYGDKLECSVLIKLVPGDQSNGYKNFWAAHTTWRPYYAMVRTYKVYDFPWAASGPVIIASSPGLLHSKDDWYTTDRFVVMETTNGVYNESLYAAIGPKSALSWQRVQLANFGATSALEWVELFKRENSGTYNNQWMVLDVELLAKRAQHEVFWIVEQLPGYTEQADVTGVLLEQGYWAAYNVPYFPTVYQLAGYPTPNVYSTCPRARIFARDHSNVKDRASIRHMIRSNSYQTDPLSDGVPSHAICSRYDLQATQGNWTRHPFGCVDGKAIDFAGMVSRATDLVSGPTHQEQTPFNWSGSGLDGSVAHEGSVDVFGFDWDVWRPMIARPRRTMLKWESST